MKQLLNFINRHKSGEPTGIYSVCCAHPLVIEASMRHALASNETIVLESTSNQVNQAGGYTGMTPENFHDLALGIAEKVGLDAQRVILGGDHLGPNCWQDLPANEAMEKSATLIYDYVKAGFRKIHLDCSMPCLGDETPLSDTIVAERAAALCATAEQSYKENGEGTEPPVYIIGTEVPVPGGAHEELDELHPTTVNAARTTLDIHRDLFKSAGLNEAWTRVIGLVVQPGVEFDHHKVVQFIPQKAQSLSKFVDQIPGLVYEAHSTDYQTSQNLKELVKGHFAILKVGPWLTYAMREAIWALDAIEREWVDEPLRANTKTAMLNAMDSDPVYWQKYYLNKEQEAFDCQFSLSDRIRYYWPNTKVDAALNKLIENLDSNPPPLTLISQYLPNQHTALISGEITQSTKAIIFHKIGEVLEQYSAACHQNTTEKK